GERNTESRSTLGVSDRRRIPPYFHRLGNDTPTSVESATGCVIRDLRRLWDLGGPDFRGSHGREAGSIGMGEPMGIAEAIAAAGPTGGSLAVPKRVKGQRGVLALRQHLGWMLRAAAARWRPRSGQ